MLDMMLTSSLYQPSIRNLSTLERVDKKIVANERDCFFPLSSSGWWRIFTRNIKFPLSVASLMTHVRPLFSRLLLEREKIVKVPNDTQATRVCMCNQIKMKISPIPMLNAHWVARERAPKLDESNWIWWGAMEFEKTIVNESTAREGNTK
jgi:hypothetical protein